jgi:hypothetical protein
MIAQLGLGVFLGHVEADDRRAAGFDGVSVVLLQDFSGDGLIAVVRNLGRKLVVEHVRKALVKHQGQDEVFELGGVGGAADGTGGVPQPGLKLRDIQTLVGCSNDGKGTLAVGRVGRLGLLFARAGRETFSSRLRHSSRN